MTDRQEIRVKSVELAIDLMKVTVGTSHSIPKGMTEAQAKIFTDCAIVFAERFEKFILETPEKQQL